MTEQKTSCGPKAFRRRLWLAMAGIALAIVLVPFSRNAERQFETEVHIRGSEAERVDRELSTDFGSPYAHRVVIAVEGLHDPDSDNAKEALSLLVSTLRAEPQVTGVVSRLDSQDDLFLGKGGGTLVIVGLQPRDGSVETDVPTLRERLGWLEDQLRPQFPDVKLELTGETPLNFDLRTFSAQDVRQAEARVLPVTFVLLLLAFGSLVAAMLPVGVGVLAISMTLGAAALLTHEMQLSILVHNLATMIGLGLGIDYALLMVNRFREALADGHDSGNAADIAAALAGRTLAISASTVAIGFSALLIVPISEIRSIGVSGLLVTAMSIVLSILVLPFVLGLLGERINAGRIRIPVRWSKSAHHPATSRAERWRRWGMAVTNRPWTALLIAGLPLLLLTYQARRLTTGLPAGDWLPPAAESVHAVHSLEAMGRAGIVQSLRVVVELPPDSPPASAAGWRAISRMTKTLAADPRAEKVVSLPSLLEMAESPADLAQLPEDSRASFLRRDGRATLIEIFPSITESPNDQIRWVLELRKADAAAMTGLAGTKLRVGGIAALNADYQEMVQKYLPWVMGAVVSGSLLALLVGLRSLLAAVKGVVLNLLSVGASFGALVLVFQEGHGSEWFGVVGGTGRVYPLIPILSFAIVFGLSMDYEVFLVARVLEERRRGLSEQAAIAEGLAGTAGLITSAAAIMIAAFAAFTLGSFLVIKMLGFTLAVAVLIDATIVRMVIGPALLQLAGDWNWWPLGLYGSKAMPVTETGL